MLPTERNRQQQPAFFSRLISVLLKSIFLLALLFVLDKLLPSISQQTQSFVVSKWQQINLLQQELPTENSLPSPLPEQHLTDTWGGARSEGRSHEGIDIFAPRGTPIKATTAGVISKVGQNNLGGRVVVIVGPGGAGHYYAHMEDYADISTNDWVNAGDVIGYVGNSGNAKGTPPHVHYGIYINGRAVNPYPLLSKNN
ncbi:M23 family metallopeptidase [Psychrobacter sp. LV10R520-6]|uniref:M23 family metallopeptidase n=1 Tax=Psychrobacter sp. LV10R520-6 TaxID=1415574 RepID=UPI0024CA0400|nr:M23 family metallopeptidase [Psychrobacter sp. LV10R520-6]SNT70772.1 Peptidase family M23 [Psychrobacter sp. LV10R520-6]